MTLLIAVYDINHSLTESLQKSIIQKACTTSERQKIWQKVIKDGRQKVKMLQAQYDLEQN
jgi:hypothetical protein